MKKILSFITLILLLHFHAKAQDTPHRIVFQFTNAVDTNQQKAFVKQLENLTDYWKDAQCEVVLYNQGVELLMKSNSAYLERLHALSKKGVSFFICENTLKNRKLSKEVFISDIAQYVPAGIAEIVLKQEAGWSYIKGGF
ncbi:MAG: DsrE family protein [Bacteroidetes bacterium]|nr:DsrE family protein [Bacteroidota bacterium]MBK8144855.1 DsrE family protein [Bacteroidota bacterium]MBP6314286.1 DsrE family protein [Chitinophagaceae bacterium]